MYPFDVSDFVGYGPRLRFRDIARTSPQIASAANAPVIPQGALDECKQWARVVTNAEDNVLQNVLIAALDAVETDAETALLTETRSLYLDFFPAWEMELRFPPVQSVTAITYLNFQGISTILDPSLYRVDPTGRPGIVTPAYGTVWPVAFPVVKAVQVDFVTGNASWELVPANAKLALYLMFTSFYWQREMSEREEDSYWRCLDRIRWRHD